MLPMNFDGHQIYKIGNDWVFDITEYIGYRVLKDDCGQVTSYDKAFYLEKSNNGKKTKFIQCLDVPVGVMRKAAKIVDIYCREAFIND